MKISKADYNWACFGVVLDQEKDCEVYKIPMNSVFYNLGSNNVWAFGKRYPQTEENGIPSEVEISMEVSPGEKSIKWFWEGK